MHCTGFVCSYLVIMTLGDLDKQGDRISQEHRVGAESSGTRYSSTLPKLSLLRTVQCAFVLKFLLVSTLHTF